MTPRKRAARLTQERLDRVLQRLCLLADIEPQEAQRHSAVAEFAAQEMLKRLKRGTDTAQNEERVLMLCAANAYYKYALLAAGESGSIRLGDVSVSGGGVREAECARALVEEFCAACADILCDSAFVFGRMPG